MRIQGFSHSVIGGREINQDSFLVDDPQKIYAVADGIGGGLKGEVASQMAVSGLKELLSQGTAILDAVKRLQQSIYNEALTTFGEPLMGTTLTAVQIVPTGEGFTGKLCHVGDSHCYVYDGVLLKQLSEDHESYDESFQGSVLNSYLGIDIRTYALKIQEETIPIVPGQRLLLCSDGLYKQMSDMRILELIRENFTQPAELLTKMCDEASKTEYSDNVTVVYVEIENA